MLVLSRKINEGIHIGPDIVVTVLKIRGNQVSLGIQAPGAMRVLRLELEENTEETSRTDESSERS